MALAAPVRPASPALAYVRDLFQLTKPRITATVLVTTAGGLWLAPGRVPWTVVLVTLVEVAAVVASACVFNGWMERDIDAKMRRTKDRPLAARRVSPNVALAFAIALPAGALPALARMLNPLTARLTALALVSYAFVYTPMKQRTSDALLVGAVPGALPPLIGWTAATNAIELGGVVLFALLFVWQLPHFLAIALYLKEDYARGGLRVLPLEHGDRAARRRVALWSIAQLVVSLLLVPLGMAGIVYAVVAAVAGVAFVVLAVRGLALPEARVNRWARQLMLASVLYLLVLFAAIGVSAA